MIHLPCNVPLLSQIMPGQNVPVQTSCNNFPAFQQPQMAAQQMQTNPCPTNPQDPFKPFYQLHQADVLVANHHGQLPPRNPWPQPYQLPANLPPNTQTQSNYGSLPQNVLDQIRNCVSTAAPIFILPGGCHQSVGHQQTGPPNQGGASLQTGQSTGVNNPPSIYCPPSFYPYPIPMPVFDPFGAQARSTKDTGCSCCRKQQDGFDRRNRPFGCCCNVYEQEEHRCTATTDDTVCSKRNCPASISLQALASQLLSLPGIISCATTRLILRKIPGSNITNTMEDTMDKALKAIGTLTKDQLLVESRNAQQVNALINLHMTTNLPANIIPLLTLLQLKVNVLKAQVEALINKKVMECQGYGFEVEASGPIDPTVLTMKTNAELRQLLSALRQKECDERVNANFSPYHSQKVIAEARLNNVQAKIRQVEAEFERRRCISVPTPPRTLGSRVIQQFSESRCTFGFAQANLFEPYVQSAAFGSPDPFAQAIRCPKRLCLKPYEPIPETSQKREESTAVTTAEDGTSMCKDAGTGECAVNCSEEKGVQRKSSADTCSCEGSSSSEESLAGGKKKLRLRIDEKGTVTITSRGCSRGVSLLKLASNVVAKVEKVPEEDRAGELVGRKEGDDFEIVTGQSVVDDSEVQILESERLDSDSREFEVITISDDDDDSTTSRTFDTAIASVKVEPESDIDTRKKVEIRIDPVEVKTVKSTCYVDVVAIKKEAAEECSSETTTKSIKVEPELKKVEEESDKTTATIQVEPNVHVKSILRRKEDSIEKKSADDKVDGTPSHHIATKSVLVKSETEKPEASAKSTLKMKEDHPSTSIETKSEGKRKDGKKPLNSKTKTPKLKRKTEDGNGNAAKQSEAILKVEQIKPGRDKDPETQNTDESPSGRTLFANIKAMFEGKVSTEKPIVEDVSADQGTGSDAAATGRTLEKRSSDLYKSTLAVTLKPTTRKVAVERKIKPEWVSSKDETNTEGGGSWGKNKAGGNAEIVSMMARVKYDGQFDDFWGWSIDECINENRKERCTKNDGDCFPKNINESGMYLFSEKTNSSFTFNNQRYQPSLATETKDKIQGGALLEKMFPRNRRTTDERTANGLKRFPPLKHSNPNGIGTTTGIAENILREEEIQSVCWKSLRDGTDSYRRDSKMENSIVSAIYSLFENQLVSFGSFLSNIPNFQGFVSSLHLDKFSRNRRNENASRSNEQTFNDPGNKKVRTGRDDWVLPGSSANVRQGDERRTSGGNRVSTSEGCSSVREMRHSIIVDREKQNYVLMWGSISGQLRELSRNGFERPYRTRRSLVIRSRPKNPGNSRHGRSRPFTILKRSKKSKVFVPRAAKRGGQLSKTCEKFSLLPEIPEESMRAFGKSSGEFVKVPENEIAVGNIERDNDTISNHVFVSTGDSLIENGRACESLVFQSDQISLSSILE